MTLLNPDQDANLSRLRQKTRQRVEVLAHLEADYERRRRERTDQLDLDQMLLVKELVEQKTPKRRIGEALGEKNHYRLTEFIERAMMLDDLSDVDQEPGGTVVATRNGDRISLSLSQWNDWPNNPDFGDTPRSGTVDFTPVEDQWMPASDGPLAVAVERELFTDGGSERLMEAFVDAQ